MPIQYQQAATYMGMEGTIIFTADLISLAEALSRNNQQSSMTMNELLACGQSSITFPNPFSNTKFSLSFDEVKQVFPASDFDNSVVIADIRFQPDPTRNPTLYPSDMVEQYRSLGLAEEKIQELIEWEKTVRGG